MAVVNTSAKTWQNVPNGSTLILALEVPAGKIVTGNVTIEAGGVRTTVDDARLQPGPARVLLESPKSYAAEVEITFADACVAKFNARIETPAGAQHGDAMEFTPQGAAGGVDLGTINVFTI